MTSIINDFANIKSRKVYLSFILISYFYSLCLCLCSIITYLQNVEPDWILLQFRDSQGTTTPRPELVLDGPVQDLIRHLQTLYNVLMSSTILSMFVHTLLYISHICRKGEERKISAFRQI